jgi:adenine-specific DNA methylase
MRTLLLCNKENKQVALVMEVDKKRKSISFGIARGPNINGKVGTKRARGPVVCPFCAQPTSEADLRRAGREGAMSERMLAVIVEDPNGKEYRQVEDTDISAFREASSIQVERPAEVILPEINGEDGEDLTNSTGIRVHLYGMKTWGALFNARQLVALQTFVTCLHEAIRSISREFSDPGYRRALATYLGLWLSRNAMRMSTVGAWHTGEEKIEKPFEGARLSMKWDFPEANPFSNVSGGFLNQLDFILRVIRREGGITTTAEIVNGDAAHGNFPNNLDVVITDPPYFDEAAYADLSDFFYIWLKRGLADEIPEYFSTPQTPKSQEATALRHRHPEKASAADRHFTTKLSQVFDRCARSCRPDSIVSVVFAHQETEAWTALIHSLFAANLTIDATWPIEMEMRNRPRAQNSAALQTSITVICRPRVAGPVVALKTVRLEISRVVADAVKRFWAYGFRGSDLLVACYGPAVGVFGKYAAVEKADGTRVEIPELLELARQAARDVIAGEFHGDPTSVFYYIWANLYGSSTQRWDDARTLVQIGGGGEEAIEVAKTRGLLVVEGPRCKLALLRDRAKRRTLGLDKDAPMIDCLDRAMLLWSQEKRHDLVSYLSERDLLSDDAFWKLAQSLFEVLSRDLEDWKLLNALLSERETLRAEVGAARLLQCNEL